ncbi:pyridoxamine 5'-phosphate oxidase family protein [Aldersonia sp. NBC_00410]|uniref:pyridoxamine 5'-phosphate oxidase family protein n=1 Tax=Aldersonia sp. NBC_00410 TaxID=2975954 RepID=UPI00225B1C1E|nr:pyridoxamine 5'-phosphate oxidase family protein [Aldersonia sp. NBC_00410]MCX5043860.1 pyridoxamine 5'-phosphate oxidase family protein [Aldersonia sp. NBC_00410]
MAEPRASAPILFGARSDNTDLLPWSWARNRLRTAPTYWLASTKPDGRPHCRPVWGVWLDEQFWFSTGSLARHNLAGNDAVTVHLDDGDAALIVEGRAHRVRDRGELQQMCDAYSPKYDWPMAPEGDEVRDRDGTGGPVFVVHGEVAFGWRTGFTQQTRWTFESPAR